MEGQEPEPSLQPADGTSEGTEEQQRRKPKMPFKQKKPTIQRKSSLKGTHASPMTIQQKAFEIVTWIKTTDDFIHSGVSQTAICKQFQFHDTDHKRKVC